MDAKKMKDRCWFATAEGRCGNPESCEGAACCHCEAYVKAKPGKGDGENTAEPVNAIEFPGATMIPVDELEPHPDAAAYPRRDGDNEAVASTMDEGLHEPLVVKRKDGGDGWWVLDGCSRLAAALALGMKALPCLEVAGVRDARRFAMVKNGMRRRVSTGTRVLSYVEMNYAEILAAQPPVSHDTHGGISRNTPTGGERWQMAAIAKRLNVSNKDVIAAWLLARCLKEGRMPAWNEQTKRQEIGGEAGAEEMRKLEEMHDNVLVGETPVRRWAGGFKSSVRTADKPRPKIDYPNHAKDTFIRLGTVFEGWLTISGAERDRLLYKILQPRLADMPDEIRVFLAGFLQNGAGK